MKKTILALSIAAFLFAPNLRAADAKYPPINPALLYWQATAQLPQLTEDQAKDLRAMASGKQPFDAEKASHLHLDDGSLRLLRRAADSPASCDWGLPLEDGPAMAMPHISKLNQNGSLIIVKAESLFAAGQVQEGIEWLLVAHRMARHAGAGDILISHLVQLAMETNALRAAARHCLAWDADTRHTYAVRLNGLPPLHTTQAGLRGERSFVDWVERHFQAGGKSDPEIQAIMNSVVATGGEKTPDKEALAAQFEPGAMTATLAEWRGLQTRLEAAAGQPWLQGQPEIKTLSEEAVHNPHIIVRTSFPMTTSVFEKGFVVATLHTMLDAALQHGPQLDEATAATSHDAFEGAPLRWTKNADGTLTLFTAQQHPAGKDLSLQFGK